MDAREKFLRLTPKGRGVMASVLEAMKGGLEKEDD